MIIIIWHILIGLIDNLLIGHVTRWLNDAASPSIEPKPTAQQLKEKWTELTKGNEGGAYVGYLERLLFFRLRPIGGGGLTVNVLTGRRPQSD